MKVVLISGSLPPDFCGIGDYTARLATALRDEGAEAFTVSLRGNADYQARSLARFGDWLRELHPDILHLQYPGAAFRKSLFPLALASRFPNLILTLHEYGLSHPLRKGVSRFLVRHARAVIVPSPEIEHALPPGLLGNKPTATIPIGPTFEPRSVPDLIPLARIPLLHFGFINRSRSFEDWGVLLSLLEKQNPATDVIFITGTPERAMEVFVIRERLKERAPSIRVQWLHQTRAEAISEFLTHHPAIAYLPFVDGLSERRTSLITLLAHGVPCLVTSPKVPLVHLRPGPGLVFVERPEDALLHFERLQDPPSYRIARADALRQVHAFSWTAIARRHLDFYAMLPPLS